MVANVNTLCETQAQCPDIPAEYFNQDAPIVTNTDEADLLITLTSFFGGYAILLIAFVIFSMCRNQISDSRKAQRARIILILCTVLIETFDVLTDAAQINNIFAGVDCGTTECVKQDRVVGIIMIPLVVLGSVGTLISMYTFCKTTTVKDIEPAQQKKYDKLDRWSTYLKVWCENVPILCLLFYWLFVADGGLAKYSLISATTIVSLLVSGFNFYWMIFPILCKCCLCCGCNSDSTSHHRYETEQQAATQTELATTNTSAQPASFGFVPNDNHTVVVAQPYVQQQQVQSVNLPPGWMQCVDANGRVYYQNSTTQQTQWERPVVGTAATVPQYAPSVPSGMAPRPIPMQSSQVAPEWDDGDPDAYYYREDDDISCCARACLWCGCVMFTAVLVGICCWYSVSTVAVTSLSQSAFAVLSVDDTCLVPENFLWSVTDLESNVTGTTYPLYFYLSSDSEDPYPVLDDGTGVISLLKGRTVSSQSV